MLMSPYVAKLVVAVPALIGVLLQTPDEVDLGSVFLLFALLAGMAFVIEAVVELIAAAWIKDWIPDETKRRNVLRVIASLIGIVFTVSYGLDIFAVLVAIYADILNLEAVYPEIAQWAGTIVTGISIGRGAQWFHDIGKSRFGLDGD